MQKKRVLIVGEFVGLQTGYSIYLYNLMTQLSKRGDLELAQLAMYAFPDRHAELISKLPWKTYCNMPTNKDEEDLYNANAANEFGAWKFDQACVDFLPHIVIGISDPWMVNFIFESPFRRYFKLVYMAPHDGQPGQDEWFGLYKQVDHLLTYQDWSLNQLKQDGYNLLNLEGSAPPQADTENFKLITNKKQHKASMGIKEDAFIIGMVARNQKRKLYPELAQSFREFLERMAYEDTKNMYLYWHLAYPDLGWNIPALIKEYGLSRKILFTYCCIKCQFYCPSFWQDVNTICPRCHTRSMTFSSSTYGLTHKQLGTIYGLFDLYVQYTTLAGFEIPIIEAASCGVPVCGTDTTGLSDNVRKLGGFSIPIKSWHLEAETRRMYPVPDNEALIEYIKKFVSYPDAVRTSMGINNYNNCMTHYGNWEQVAKTWFNVIDKVPYNDSGWLGPPDIGMIPPGYPNPEQVSDEQFVSWLLNDVLRRPEWVNSYQGLRFFRDLNWGRYSQGKLGVFAGDLSLLGARTQWGACDRNLLFESVKGLRERFNQAEIYRIRTIEMKKKNENSISK